MTKTERSMLLCLMIFLLLGICVRAYRSSHNKIDLQVVHDEKLDLLKANFDTVRKQRKRVDLNEAREEDLLRLPGVGPKRAQAILLYRKEKGRFLHPEEIMKVKGIGKGRFRKMKDYLLVR